MAFLIHSVTSGAIPAVEYIPSSAIAPKAGMALVLSSGLLAAAGGTDKPGYISMLERGEAVDSGTLIPVIRVCEDIIFTTQADGALTGVSAGSKLKLSGGMKVSKPGSGESGTAEVVWLEGTEAGSRVHVRFS